MNCKLNYWNHKLEKHFSFHRFIISSTSVFKLYEHFKPDGKFEHRGQNEEKKVVDEKKLFFLFDFPPLNIFTPSMYVLAMWALLWVCSNIRLIIRWNTLISMAVIVHVFYYHSYSTAQWMRYIIELGR